MDRESLSRLSNTVCVQDVMTGTSLLRRADSLEHARILFHEYDVVPYPRKGKIEGYFRRYSDDVKPLEVDHLLSADTGILQLPNLLLKHHFYFVVSANAVVGYVHYSDLNKVVTKVPFFVMFQAAERRLWEKVEGRISEADLYKVFDEEEAKGFVKKYKKAATRNVDLSWVGIFSFPYILKLARHYGLLDLPNPEIKLLKETRNSVAHSDKLLVSRYEDVPSLAEARKMIQAIIDE